VLTLQIAPNKKIITNYIINFNYIRAWIRFIVKYSHECHSHHCSAKNESSKRIKNKVSKRGYLEGERGREKEGGRKRGKEKDLFSIARVCKDLERVSKERREVRGIVI